MKIAFILYTNGLEYDDRIRKEMLSIKAIFKDAEFKVFAFQGDYHKEVGVLSYGVPYELLSIKKCGGRKDVISQIRKEMDFYSKVNKKVKDFDVLWVCDHHPLFFPLFSRKPVIWDLHEIPDPIIGSKVKNLLFHIMERRCKCLIHANQERINYLIKHNIIKCPWKNYVLRNYPDREWLLHSKDTPSNFINFKQWLGNNEYIYIQGLNNKGRYPVEVLSSILEAHSLKAVVLGNVSEDILKEFAGKYPDYNKYVYFAGQVIQAETAPYIAHCKFSIVLYSTDIPNNRYCEPNRMFQVLGMGKPVLVGQNEPMYNIIRTYRNGISLASDGRNIAENVEGIRKMIEQYTDLEEKALHYKDIFAWESQANVFENAFKAVGIM